METQQLQEFSSEDFILVPKELIETLSPKALKLYCVVASSDGKDSEELIKKIQINRNTFFKEINRLLNLKVIFKEKIQKNFFYRVSKEILNNINTSIKKDTPTPPQATDKQHGNGECLDFKENTNEQTNLDFKEKKENLCNKTNTDEKIKLCMNFKSYNKN